MLEITYMIFLFTHRPHGITVSEETICTRIMRVSLKNGARAIKTIMKSTSVCQLIEKMQTTVEIDIFLKFEELVNFSNLFYVFNKEFQKYTHAQTNA
jgi:hypothetical protein